MNEKPTNPHSSRFGTCSLYHADISFFPLVIPPADSHYERFKISERQQILGIGLFPEIVASKLELWNVQKHCLFGGKKLEYDFVTFEQQYKTNFVLEYWERIIYQMQRRKFPRYFIIAPQATCEELFKRCLSPGENIGIYYYYHDPVQVPAKEKEYHLLLAKLPGFFMSTKKMSKDDIFKGEEN